MPSKRLELTLSDEVWTRLEKARGHEPRASFVKRALEAFLPEPGVQVSRGRVDVVLSSEDGRVLEQQSYVEEPFVVAGPVTRGCPECGGDMRERDPLSRVRVCADCGLTERS